MNVVINLHGCLPCRNSEYRIYQNADNEWEMYEIEHNVIQAKVFSGLKYCPFCGQKLEEA